MGIRFCPRCGSQNFEEVREGKLPGMPWHYANQNSFRCKECGFTSTIFPEVENKKELDKIKKEMAKNRTK